MKIIFIFLLLSSSLSVSWTSVSSNTSAQLTSTALTQYLSAMKNSFQWVPPLLLLKSEEATLAQQLPERIGSTQILVKNEAQLLAYSLQHTGKTIVVLTLEIEREAQQYAVYIVNEGLKTILRNGTPIYEYAETSLGRACVLRYDKNLRYQGIDCLLLSEDAEQD